VTGCAALSLGKRAGEAAQLGAESVHGAEPDASRLPARRQTAGLAPVTAVPGAMSSSAAAARLHAHRGGLSRLQRNCEQIFHISGCGLAGMVVLGWWLDLMILEVFPNLNDSMV